MRGKAVVLTAAALAACGGPTKQERARYAAKLQHYSPPDSLSRVEYGGMVERRFRALDRNDDGYIEADELPAVGADSIRSLDKDGDGRVSAQEFSAGMLARFDHYDLNRDGTMTPDEYRTVKRSQGGAGRP